MVKKILTDVSGQPIDPIFRGQDIQKDRLSFWISCVTTQKSTDLKPGSVRLNIANSPLRRIS